MRFHDNEEITNYVNLFVSVIICFPEITTIKYNRDDGTIHFHFILKNRGDDERIQASLHTIDKAYQSYHRMEGRKAYDFSVKTTAMGDFAVLEAVRDIRTVTRSEIAFLVELFRDAFREDLVIEPVDQEEDEYRWFQQEVEEMQSEEKRIKFDEKSIGNNILVCREAGKVLVFSNS